MPITNLLQNPVLVSTPMLQSWKATIAAAYGSFYTLRVRKIVWENPTTAGDNVTITDGGAVTLLTLTAQASLVPQEVDFVPAVSYRDFQVTQITSGQLSIFLA